MKNNLLKIAIASSVFALAHPVFAETSGWYAGAGLGQSKLSDWLTESDAEDVLGVAGDAAGVVYFDGTINSDTDDSDTAWKLFGGFQVNENFAIEASYINLGEATASSEASGDFSIDGVTLFPGSLGVELESESKALAVDAVGLFKPSAMFDLFVKAGLYYADSELKVTVIATDASGSYSSSESITGNNTNLHAGIGANAWFTENLGVRVEWEMFKSVEVDDAESDVSLLSASVIYKF